MKKVVFYLLLISFCCYGCLDKDSYYHNYQFLKHNKWDRQDSLVWHDTLIVSPNEQALQLWVGIRHFDRYPYQNAALHIEAYVQDSCYREDVSFSLCDDTGDWISKGTFGSIFFVEKEVKTFLPAEGSCPITIRISHRMQEKTLKGIENIGIRITSASSGRHPNVKR